MASSAVFISVLGLFVIFHWGGNREYAQVLVEQNLNGRTDTTYTYGTDRISRELFSRETDTSYYLYDGRGSVTGLTNPKGTLTAAYAYSPEGGDKGGSNTINGFNKSVNAGKQGKHIVPAQPIK